MEAAKSQPGEDEPCPGVQQQLLLPDRLPRAPHSPAAQPLPVFLPSYGGSGCLPAALPLLCLARCCLSLGAGLATGTPISHSPLEPWQGQQGPSVAPGHPSSVSGFLFMEKRLLPPKKHSQTYASNPGDTRLCCIRCKA